MTQDIKRAKVKLDFTAAKTDFLRQSSEATDQRWAKAEQITSTQPNALSINSSVVALTHSPSIVTNDLQVSSLVVGQVYELPVTLLDSNTYGARFFYRFENVDKVGTSMTEDSQLVPVNGFIKGERIELYDGETRLRSARSTGRATLQVKIDKPPGSPQEQHRRSALFNSLRSNHTALDIAVRLKQFLDEGVYSSQDELVDKYRDENDHPISKSGVSMLIRISRIPMPFLHLMSEKNVTSTLTTAYEISGIFESEAYKLEPEKYDSLAREIIKEIQEKELGKQQSKLLIDSKMDGPKSRIRAESVPVKYGGTKGTLKVFAARGQLDLSFKGLSNEKLNELKDAVEKLLAAQTSNL